MRYWRGNAARRSIDVLRLRLLAAVGGVSVSVACAGRSTQHERGDDGASANAGKGASGGAGGSVSGAGGRGGTGGGFNAGGSDGGAEGGIGALGGSDGGTGAIGDSMGGGVGGSMGGLGASGPPACKDAGEYGPGLRSCASGYVHREQALECPLPARQNNEAGAAGDGGFVEVPEPPACESDADCTAGPNGYCVFNERSGEVYGPFCSYACVEDSDCDAAELCVCHGFLTRFATSEPFSGGTCVSASCKSDAACGVGSLCVAQNVGVCGEHVPERFDCQKPEDECSGLRDCGDGVDTECSRGDDGYVCGYNVTCGRPFLVGGALRQSALTENAAWLDDACASIEGETLAVLDVPDVLDAPAHKGLDVLDVPIRAAIAEHFARAGLMEHASIAAFARFALQLLALGAPPELVRDATAAMADETRHATLCFGLASRYAGHAVGPGPLDVSGALDAVTLLDVVDLVVAEGCVGETAAALEAAWAAENATDPVVRRVLTGIAEDEARHAELAARFIAWAATRDARVPERVERQWRALCGGVSEDAAPRGPDIALLVAHGVPSASTRREARRAALDDIVPSLLAQLRVNARGHVDSSATVRPLAPTV